MDRKKLIVLALVLLLAVALSGCAQQNQAQNTPGSAGVAGFWPGLWHGFILPVSFVASLFDHSIGIYEIHNDGNLYNLGFVLGTWLVFAVLIGGANSGPAAARRKGGKGA
ncbi:MAG: hypothetical protein ACYDET_08930 [Thermoleophilia bacterium]